MTRNIAIKDKLYERLSTLKGNDSFSYIIESIMEKAGIPIHSPIKINEPDAKKVKVT